MPLTSGPPDAPAPFAPTPESLLPVVPAAEPGAFEPAAELALLPEPLALEPVPELLPAGELADDISVPEVPAVAFARMKRPVAAPLAEDPEALPLVPTAFPPLRSPC